ncbi:hypothetical protein PsorP6_018441 [Peronosclerospora sorghi]|nr:hypothetical protein PsorP6_018441 [Peronosclerospora sorghi]
MLRTFFPRSLALPSSVTARAFVSASTTYDVVVLGGGPGGYVAAIQAAPLGARHGVDRVAWERRRHVSQRRLHYPVQRAASLDAHLLHTAQQDFKRYGMDAPDVTVKFRQMMKAKEESGADIDGGDGKSLYEEQVEALVNKVSVALNGNETVRAKNSIIATGSDVTPFPPVPVDNEARKIVDSIRCALVDVRARASQLIVGRWGHWTRAWLG